MLSDLLRHKAARFVLQQPDATDEERAKARAVLGLPPEHLPTGGAP